MMSVFILNHTQQPNTRPWHALNVNKYEETCFCCNNFSSDDCNCFCNWLSQSGRCKFLEVDGITLIIFCLDAHQG